MRLYLKPRHVARDFLEHEAPLGQELGREQAVVGVHDVLAGGGAHRAQKLVVEGGQRVGLVVEVVGRALVLAQKGSVVGRAIGRGGGGRQGLAGPAGRRRRPRPCRAARRSPASRGAPARP